MKRYILIPIFALVALFVCSCTEKGGDDEPVDVNYITSRTYSKHLNREEALARGYICLDYTQDPVTPIASRDTIFVDLTEQSKVEIHLLSPAMIEWMKCTEPRNSFFVPDTLYMGQDGSDHKGEYFWIFYPHSATMGNVSATHLMWDKLVIERSEIKEDYAVEFFLGSFDDVEGLDCSIPEHIKVRVFQTAKGEALAHQKQI